MNAPNYHNGLVEQSCYILFHFGEPPIQENNIVKIVS